MTQADRERALAAFRLGLGRQATPRAAWAEHPLAALAMASQALRFAAPATPAPAGPAWSLPVDAAPLLPDSARAALLRLAARLDAASAHLVARLLLAQLRATGHRLHPFDLPHLPGLLAAAHDDLGTVERAWMARDIGEAPPDAVDAETWREATPAERLRFLRELRLADPAAARTLLESGFAAETAKARAELLGALDVRLGPEDAPFLAACAADRAATVRQAAEALLAKLPGSAAHAARLKAAVAALKIETSGVPRRSRLTCQAPTKAGRPVAPLQLLDQIGLTDLAAALGLAADALVGMAADDAMRHALSGCALWDGRQDLALRLLHGMAAPLWPGDVDSLGAFATLPPAEGHSFAAAAFRPEAPSALGGDWHRLGRLLGAPLDAGTVTRMLSSPAWPQFVESVPATHDADAALLPIAALVPASLATEFADTLAALPASRRPRATLLLACLAEFAALPHPKDPA